MTTLAECRNELNSVLDALDIVRDAMAAVLGEDHDTTPHILDYLADADTHLMVRAAILANLLQAQEVRS